MPHYNDANFILGHHQIFGIIHFMVLNVLTTRNPRVRSDIKRPCWSPDVSAKGVKYSLPNPYWG